MNYPDSSKTEQMAKRLGVSVQALEQYLQLKRVEVAPEEPAKKLLKGEEQLTRELVAGR